MVKSCLYLFFVNVYLIGRVLELMFDLKIFLRKLLIFFIGLLIIQTGVAIFIQTAIGSDPFTVFTQGISKILHLSVGNANLVITFTFLVIIVFVFKKIKSINIGTLIALVFAGIFINLMNSVLSVFNFSNLNIFIRLLLVCFSCILIGIGFSMQNATNLGVAPNDLFILIVTERSSLSYKWIRIIFDLVLVIIGFLLCGLDSFGKTLGIGTILNALIQGPIIHFFMPKVEYILKPLFTEKSKNIAIQEK